MCCKLELHLNVHLLLSLCVTLGDGRNFKRQSLHGGSKLLMEGILSLVSFFLSLCLLPVYHEMTHAPLPDTWMTPMLFPSPSSTVSMD